jgi:hypothetical protein
MSIPAPLCWPSLSETMAHNGSLVQAGHGIQLEQAILHLCGFGHSHGAFNSYDSVNGARIILAAGTMEVRVHQLPYTRDVQVNLLVDGAEDDACEITLDMEGANTATYAWAGHGATKPDEVAGWQPFYMAPVHGGTSTGGDTESRLIITNIGAVSVWVFAGSIRQVPNLILET